MRPIDKNLAEWKSSLCGSVDVGGLYSRNAIAHKWKAPFRSLTLREIVAWRTQDLLEQSLLLYDTNHLLGARILLRSAFETVSVLIYINQLTRKVLSGKLDFHEFSEKTSILLLGSRDSSTMHKAINIVTVIEKCDARYPGLKDLYASLSESAHPNYEGTCIGYSVVDRKNYITTFSNRWKALYSKSHIQNIELCTTVFYSEYNEEWPDAFEDLELWITQNDDKLEATK
ncbi:hypothetical protein SAMN02745119_00323 [Trichlorobacter thiogenes]|uniref:HEPN domain-containing protein n=1 Tax=Trichlorobacter thiogenes TaxID=115783 RepID=A0A1T4K5I3_9BACT|nr:hypothetical protein [Trichlorobacter thiogenes]SJZ37587.1 hypothetical protein SAMN02745119_00323 [Trichlorobacter thiogenes]